jgi:TolB-like protein/cytochrome c-type biogenesis protein CcmH/NrfG
LFAELRRRNVVRVAALYLIAAWLMMQVADVLFSMIGVPEGSGKLLLALLALGFPIALIFAWVYELTPEGLKKQHEVDRNSSIVRETGRKLNIAIGALAVIAILGMIADRMVPRSAEQSIAEPASPTAADATAVPSQSASTTVSASLVPSIAVLPFTDMSREQDQEYFADGLSEELLNLLAQIDGLRVIARTSSFQFKGRSADIRTIAEQLGVANVLEGSVRKSGEQIRVTAQLIRASDGSHLWSDTYDRKLDDVFTMQDEIASAVVDKLRLKLLKDAAPVRAERHDTEAYNLYLQGRFYYARRTSESLDKAVECYRGALERDPDFVLAWIGLSQTYNFQAGGTGQISIAEGSQLAREAAEKALALDPESALGHAALGRVQNAFDWDWAAADASFNRALALAPTDPDVLGNVGVMDMTMGRFESARQRYQQAIERDPLRPPLHANMALTLIAMGRLSEAETSARRALEVAPSESGGYAWGIGLPVFLQGRYDEAADLAARERDEHWKHFAAALVPYAQGRSAEADANLNRLIAEDAEFMAFQIAETYAYRNEVDQAFEWLERAYRQRDGGVSEILGSAFLKRLASDPRYAAFLQKIGLPNPNTNGELAAP